MKLSAALRDAGLKATAPRMRVLAILHASATPLCVADIVRASSGAIDQVTVYRALDSFVAAGLVQLVELQRDRRYYELADRAHHHHLVCRSCGKTEDVDACGIERMQRALERLSRTFRSVDAHALEFFGTCNSCAR